MLCCSAESMNIPVDMSISGFYDYMACMKIYQLGKPWQIQMAFPWKCYHERNASVSIKFGTEEKQSVHNFHSSSELLCFTFPVSSCSLLKNHMPPLPPPNLAIDHQVSIELMYASIQGIQPVSLRCVSPEAGGCQLTVIKASYLLRRKI